MGSVIPVGKSKTVQHPTGGTVIEIHAVDGQVVEPGAPIVTLDPIIDQAELGRLQSRYALLQAIEARLVAQYADEASIRFPGHFHNSDEMTSVRLAESLYKIRYDQLMADQQSEFDDNRELLIKELSELDQQVSSARGQLKGLKSQKNNTIKERKNLAKQIKRIQPLLKEGHYARNEADELERLFLRLSGELDRLNTEITELEFRVSEILDRKAATIAGRRGEISRQLSETRGEMDSVKNQISAAGNTVEKSDIRASAGGILTKSAVNTIGGVIRPGEVIAEIVPVGGYKIEARIALRDVDYVQTGQDANVVITAFNRQLNDPIPATVDYVAADSEVDEKTGEEYFTARLTLVETPNVIQQLNNLRAGMQGEVYITTGERTFLNYVLKPLSDGFRRAFRES